jgi:hypothetical protein
LFRHETAHGIPLLVYDKCINEFTIANIRGTKARRKKIKKSCPQ